MQRPWISTNLAISADGKISSRDHRPSDWTSEKDFQLLRKLRCGADALLVGRGTVDTDRMTMRVEDQEIQPLRCIVSRHGEMQDDHPIFSTGGGDIHMLATEAYRGSQGDRLQVHEGSLADFLKTLREDLGVEHLHCEGGGQLIRALAELDAIDEFKLTWAGHTILGGKDSPTATGIPGEYLPQSCQYEIREFEADADTGECYLSFSRKQAQS